MEERMIDDEYGRGIRLKKTKDGFVDAEDELVPETDGEEAQNSEEEMEISFEFPVLETDEDDEDLVGLSPEEAAALRKQKEELAAQRKAEYEQACKEGEELLQSGSFHAAELKYEKALALDEEAVEASVGYWRAKTSDFTQPDVLISEYLESGIENLEYDLGYSAVDIIKKKYRGVFAQRVADLEAEEQPLAKTLEEKRINRQGYLSKRLKNAAIGFVISAIPFIAMLVLTVVFGLKNITTRESYVTQTVIAGACAVLAFIVFGVFTNKFINSVRIYRANNRLSATEEGERLIELREYKELYEALLQGTEDGEESEE